MLPGGGDGWLHRPSRRIKGQRPLMPSSHLNEGTSRSLCWRRVVSMVLCAVSQSLSRGQKGT